MNNNKHLKLEFLEDDHTDAKTYTRMMFNLIVTIFKKNSFAFYGNVLNNFSYKFLSNGKTRPDFKLGVFYDHNRIAIAVNPYQFFKESEDEMIGLLIHEAEHILNFHVLFSPEKDPMHNKMVTTEHEYRDAEGKLHKYKKQTPLATFAMDLEVNSLKYIYPENFDPNNPPANLHLSLSKEFLLKPNSGIFPQEGQFKSLPPFQNWKWYYDKLEEFADKNQNGFSNAQGGISMPGGNNIPGNDWIDGTPPGTDGETSAEMGMLTSQNIKSYIEDILNLALQKDAGSVPGKYKQYLSVIKKTKFDWKSILRQFIQSGIVPDQRLSKRKVNKRGIAKKAFLPGRINTYDTTVMAFIDTSGSIGTKQFEDFVKHLANLRDATGAIVHIGAFDAEVHAFHELTKNNYERILKTQISFTQGGTMFGPIFKKVKESKIKPDVLLIFTDGWNFDPIPKNPLPHIPIMWVYTKNHTKQNFGRHLIMQDERD